MDTDEVKAVDTRVQAKAYCGAWCWHLEHSHSAAGFYNDTNREIEEISSKTYRSYNEAINAGCEYMARFVHIGKRVRVNEKAGVYAGIEGVVIGHSHDTEDSFFCNEVRYASEGSPSGYTRIMLHKDMLEVLN